MAPWLDHVRVGQASPSRGGAQDFSLAFRRAKPSRSRVMKVISVNVSLPRPIQLRGGEVLAGIYKEPVSGRIRVRRHNLDGDAQADLRVHGGEHKAVYAYPFEHYAHWERELGRSDLAPGAFGENLTTTGLIETEVCIGDVLRI